MNTSNIFLPDWLTRCAENRPGHLAVQCDQVRWSFGELDRQATRLARRLATMGVQEYAYYVERMSYNHYKNEKEEYGQERKRFE